MNFYPVNYSKTETMKKVITTVSFFLCSLAFFTSGCKKSSGDGTTDEPVITITTPAEGSSYTGSVPMSFSLTSLSGLDSCYLTLKITGSGAVMYYNSFAAGGDVRNKTSFSFSVTQTALPNLLTDAQCIVKAVNLNKTSVTKTINIKVKQ